jgi:hypothetical protein
MPIFNNSGPNSWGVRFNRNFSYMHFCYICLQVSDNFSAMENFFLQSHVLWTCIHGSIWSIVMLVSHVFNWFVILFKVMQGIDAL